VGLRETRKLLSQAECAGCAQDLVPTTKSLGAGDRRVTEAASPRSTTNARCARDVVLPTGDIVPCRTTFANASPTTRSSGRRWSGSPGESQNFDGNGSYVRFPGRRLAATPVAPRLEGSATGKLVGSAPAPRARRPAEVPRQAPAVQLERPCYKSKIPNVNGPAGAAGRVRDAVRTAIRKHWLDFVAIIGLILIAGAVAVFILGKQRLTLPALGAARRQGLLRHQGRDATAQAVTPGQGQTVNIAGVEVGEISKVELKDGKAVITLQMRAAVRRVYQTRPCCCGPRPASRTWSPSSSRARRARAGCTRATRSP
jgi:hypothetical protein